MSRRATWIFAAVVVAAVMTPQAVIAAVGQFSSNNATPAVIADNTMKGTNQAPGGRFRCQANGCRAIQAESFGVGNGSYGVYASSKDPVGRGLQGFNFAKTGTAIGLGGRSDSVTGRAINGLALSSSGANYGGFLETKSRSAGSVGAYGWASNTAGADHPSTPAGRNYGVYGRNDGGGVNSAGVFGFASKEESDVQGGDAPQVNGVWGRAPSANGAGLFGEGGAYGFFGAGGYAGGYGFGDTFGIGGESPGKGDGTYGVLSYTDLGVGGHVMGVTDNLAGTCTFASSTTCSVTFADAFPTGAVPVVVVTANGGSPGADRYWVEGISNTGFNIRTSGATTATFGWIAIGVDDGLSSLAPQRAARR